MTSIAAFFIPLVFSACRVSQSAVNKRIAGRPGFGILRATIVNNLVNIPLFLALFLIPRYATLRCSVDSPPDSFCTTLINLFDDSYAFASFQPFYVIPGASAFFIVFSVPILIKRMSALRVFVQLTFVEMIGSLFLDRFLRHIELSWGRIAGSAIVCIGSLVIAGGGTVVAWLRKHVCTCNARQSHLDGRRVGVNGDERDPLIAPVHDVERASVIRPAASWNGELRNDLPGSEHERQFLSANLERSYKQNDRWFSAGDATEEARFLHSVVAGGAATHHPTSTNLASLENEADAPLLTTIGLNFLCVSIGVARLMQGNLNALIVDSWGIGGASLLNGIMFSATTTILFLISRMCTIMDLSPNPGSPKLKWWMVFPGFLGATVVVLLPISIILIGSLTTFIIVILGEILTAAIYDAVFESKPISIPRIVGLLVIFAGLAVSFEFS